MKKLLLLLPFAVSAAWAQTPAAPAQGTPPAYTAGKICDATYSAETETKDHFNVASASVTIYAVPWVDIEDNHKKQVKVLDQLSKEQDKGGEYELTITETNTCDDGVTVRIADGSLLIMGMTLEGSVRATDVALQQAKEINDRYRARAVRGAKVGWDHSKAKKVKRDDLGRKLKDRE